MPETNVLYSVTAAVVVGLVAWVAVVLKSAKEPWAREVPPAPPREREADVPIEAVEAEKKPDVEPAKVETEAGPEAEAEAEAAKAKAAETDASK